MNDRSSPSAAETFLRDRFQCQYCGQRLIPVCVMSALSASYPEELPYNVHYKAGAIHRAYWLTGAEADHIVPVSRGGDGTELANHATACVLCNTRKAERTLEELGWSRVPTADATWDGCVSMYRELWQHVGRPNPKYHKGWLRAFEELGREPPE